MFSGVILLIMDYSSVDISVDRLIKKVETSIGNMQITKQVCLRCADYMRMRLKWSDGGHGGRTPDLRDRPLQDKPNTPLLIPCLP